MSQSEEVSRNEEIRAILVLGLLAVFASVRVQFSTLELTYPYGTLNLVPVIDILIIFWSLYALFMVLGLSEDSIGKSASNVFRELSTSFMKYSFIFLGAFLVPFGFIIYGLRMIYMLLIVLVIVIISILVYLERRLKNRHERLSWKDFVGYLKSGKIKKYRSFVLGLIFIFSILAVSIYPESWFAPRAVVTIAFVVAVVTITIIIMSRKPEDVQNDYCI